MCHEQNGSAAVDDFVHLRKACLLELRVAHRQHFIDNEDLRIQVRRYGKCQSHIHPTEVTLDRRLEKSLASLKIYYVAEFRANFAPAHAQDCSVHIDTCT